MFDNAALDVVIGLVFIFLLYSLLATIVQEIIATKLAFRSKILEKAILRMLEDGKTTSRSVLLDSARGFYQLIFRSNNLKNKRFATAFYTHPLLKYLAEDNWFSKPDYISATNFSKTMVDLLHGIEPNLQGINILRIRESIETGYLKIQLEASDKDNPANKNYIEQRAAGTALPDINPETRLFLQSLLSESQGDIEKFKFLLEKWFNDTMERATGWYKRYTQYILFIVGFFIAVSFNVDTIIIAKKLASDPELAANIADRAGVFLEQQKESGNQLRQLQNQGLDTTAEFAAVKSEYDSLKQRTDTLMASAKALVNNDISSVNQVLGLGYECNHPRLLHTFFFLYPDASFANFIGWLVTALAICLGAAFWYDLLSKLIRIRGTGVRKDSSTSTAGAAVGSAAPITVNVNTNPGEEAVG